MTASRRAAWRPGTEPIEEMSILWLSAGLSCDGESVALTAATQPSIEDILRGAIPWIPRIKLHLPFLARENGDEFLEYFHRGAAGTLGPFILVVEGSIPDETTAKEGYWAGFGTDHTTNQSIPTCFWIDRLAPNAWAVVAVGTCATYGGIHAMQGNPTSCMVWPYRLTRPLIVGVVHGLAGSAALALLVLATIPSPKLGILYLLVFGIGTIVGMVMMTAAIVTPFAYAERRFGSMSDRLRIASGIVGVAFGLFIAYRIGVVDGLFTNAPHWTPR